MSKVALTTVDNPYSPFTQFDDWYAFDQLKGYNSCALLARICDAQETQPTNEVEKELSIEQAIDKIVKLNFNGLYRKVTSN